MLSFKCYGFDFQNIKNESKYASVAESADAHV